MRKPHVQKQNGMALITVVIFLLVLAMLGAWAASNNSLQERMSGNSRNRDIALQAAEAALKHAEATIADWRNGPFDGGGGLFQYDATLPNDAVYWQDSANWGSYRTVPTGSLNQTDAPPQYQIHKMDNSASQSDATVFNVENYRITARAVGGDPSAIVVVQSIITYTP